ncbi:aldo/keto reductase [Luminiphilus sp.]|nr:aldo/keto reductase [Luminiphilus sp.]
MIKRGARQGIGTLGLSGRYGYRSAADVDDMLALIVEHSEFVDTATVYGDYFSINEALSRHLSKGSSCKLVNKYGANISEPNGLDLLKKEFHDDVELFHIQPPETVLIHRPSTLNINRDVGFYQVVKNVLPNARFGITTNSYVVLSRYLKEMKIDVIQVALNFCDYLQNRSLLALARDNDITVQARSVLGSGLLSGTYDDQTVTGLNDPLRGRFTETDVNYEVVKKRLSTVVHLRSIFEIFKDTLKTRDVTFSQFVYALSCYIDEVDEVITGGSRVSQILENISIPEALDENFIKNTLDDQFFIKCSAPYI